MKNIVLFLSLALLTHESKVLSKKDTSPRTSDFFQETSSSSSSSSHSYRGKTTLSKMFQKMRKFEKVLLQQKRKIKEQRKTNKKLVKYLKKNKFPGNDNPPPSSSFKCVGINENGELVAQGKNCNTVIGRPLLIDYNKINRTFDIKSVTNFCDILSKTTVIPNAQNLVYYNNLINLQSLKTIGFPVIRNTSFTSIKEGDSTTVLDLKQVVLYDPVTETFSTNGGASISISDVLPPEVVMYDANGAFKKNNGTPITTAANFLTGTVPTGYKVVGYSNAATPSFVTLDNVTFTAAAGSTTIGTAANFYSTSSPQTTLGSLTAAHASNLETNFNNIVIYSGGGFCTNPSSLSAALSGATNFYSTSSPQTTLGNLTDADANTLSSTYTTFYSPSNPPPGPDLSNYLQSSDLSQANAQLLEDNIAKVVIYDTNKFKCGGTGFGTIISTATNFLTCSSEPDFDPLPGAAISFSELPWASKKREITIHRKQDASTTAGFGIIW